MNVPSVLDDLHRIIIDIGVLALTILFIIRVCLDEIRRMKDRRGRQGSVKRNKM
jgi:hypothetical protein